MTASMPVTGLRRRTPLRWLALVSLAVGYPLVLSGRWLSGAVIALIFTTAALGLHFLTGVTGQLSLGHAFFFGVGAVVAAWLGGTSSTGFSTTELWGLGLPVWVWLPTAGLVAGMTGLVVGPSAARLGGLSLGIVTLGLVFLGRHVFATAESLSGGVNGRPVPDLDIFGHRLATDVEVLLLTLDRNQQWYFIALGVSAACAVAVRNLERSKVGCACTAVRDRDLAAAVLGVHVNRSKLTAFIIGSTLAGIGGALYGSFLGRIAAAEQFDLFLSLQFVVIIVIGGLGSRAGVFAGALFVGLLPVAIDQFSPALPFLSASGSGGLITEQQFAVILNGVALIVTLQFEPRGLSGIGNRVQQRMRSWPLGPYTTTAGIDIQTSRSPTLSQGAQR